MSLTMGHDRACMNDKKKKRKKNCEINIRVYDRKNASHVPLSIYEFAARRGIACILYGEYLITIFINFFFIIIFFCAIRYILPEDRPASGCRGKQRTYIL